MNEKKRYKSYSDAFKAEAVSLVTEQGYTVLEAARTLGIRANMIYRWKDQASSIEAQPTLIEDEQAELARLRKEVKELRMEKEILKKASAFFVKHMK